MRRLLGSVLLVVAFGMGSAWAQAATPAVPERLTLQEVLRLAKAQHPAVQQQRANTGAAEARARAARAGLLPQLTARATAQHSSRAGTLTVTDTGAGVGTATGTISSNQYTGSITLNQLLWDFGRTTGAWGAAKASAAAQEANTRSTELQILVDASRAFFNAQAQRQLLLVAEETVKNQQRHLQRVEAMIEVGSRPAIDRAQAATDYANAKVQHIQAQTAYALARATLNRAIGIESSPRYEIVPIEVTAVSGEDAELEVLVNEALSTRPELESLMHQTEAEKASKRVARSGYLPSIGVALTGNESGPELDALNPSWTAAATLSWTLFDGLRTQNNVQESDFRLAALDAAIASERQAIRYELEESRLGIRTAHASLDAVKDAERNARERLRLAEGRYETGVGNILELSDAQLALTQASAQLIQAEYQLASERTRLAFLLGRETP